MSSEDTLPPRILCVDDHKELCDELKEVLSQLPARVEVAYDGNTAYDRLLASRAQDDAYRLIILDMWVPYTLGKEVDRELGLRLLIDVQKNYQLLPFETPIVVFTQHPSYTDCVECIRSGAVDYIAKEGDPEKGKTGVEILYECCKRLLYPEAPVDPLREWLDQHLTELVSQYGGSIVAVIEETLAKEAGVDGKAFGGYVLIKGETYGDVRDQIIWNRNLRWQKPWIINVPTREVLSNG